MPFSCFSAFCKMYIKMQVQGKIYAKKITSIIKNTWAIDIVVNHIVSIMYFSNLVRTLMDKVGRVLGACVMWHLQSCPLDHSPGFGKKTAVNKQTKTTWMFYYKLVETSELEWSFLCLCRQTQSYFSSSTYATAPPKTDPLIWENVSEGFPR